MIAHLRYLPVPSKHIFSYRTVAVLVSLKELEANQLDIGLGGGWLFGYNSRFNLTGIHPQTYLTNILAKPKAGLKPVSIREKLDALLGERGWDTSAVTDVWLGVMPSYFGYIGTNPVTSYYLYKNTIGPDGRAVPKLWIVVLEVCVFLLVHESYLIPPPIYRQVDNTYGEKHIYILETGVSEVEDWVPK